MPYRKKLIEVALPLDAINDASAYDKMPGIGPHPKGIHHWWARLPLPCARVMLFASLVDDPSSDPRFVDQPSDAQDAERERLFGLMRAMMQKRMHESPEVYRQAHAEIARACNGNLPPVLDPFCGGGSIPLEAQRLGLEAHGSDLNPVPVLITKAMVEVVPRFADALPVYPGASASRNSWTRSEGLAEDVRGYSQWMRRELERRIGQLYPRGPSGEAVIAWLWARTVKCPNPACGAQMPLVRSFNLVTKAGRETWIEPIVDEASRVVDFEVRTGAGTPRDGTVRNRAVTCLVCAEPTTLTHVRAEAQTGGMGSVLMATVAEGRRGRVYLSATHKHQHIAQTARPAWQPDETVMSPCHDVDRLPMYGMFTWGDAFTPRQLCALTTLNELVAEVRSKVQGDAVVAGMADDGIGLSAGGTGAQAYADAIAVFMALAIGRCADFGNAICTWAASNEKVMHLFGKQAIPMVWDYAEANVLGDCVGSWATCSGYVADCIETIIVGSRSVGKAQQLDASASASSLDGLLISTDPPYYDNISYAALSDFFYVWLRRALREVYPDLFSTLLVPKAPELTASPYRFDGDVNVARTHFEEGFRKAFAAMKGRLDPRFPLTVYYAFKQSEGDEDRATQSAKGGDSEATTGWETMLSALVSSGFQVTATWPVRASQKWRMVSMGTNALASYIVLACRPRPENAPMATRREFTSALRKELPPALAQLTHAGIPPVDLAQATIGPGMGVFSRYSKVLEADGNPMTVRTALQIINQELDAYLTEQDGDLDGDTRFCIAWFEQYGLNEAAFGEADVLARAKNTSVEGIEEAGVLHARAGKVRLRARCDYPEDWDPQTDRRLTVWECAQHLICELERSGEEGAAGLVRRLGGGMSEDARALAYRLYAIADRKGWTDEARAYNGLVVSWPAIVEKAARAPAAEQPGLFE